MRHVIGPSWVCVECITDPVPDDDPEIPNTTKLTIWNGNMVCIYHLPIMIDKYTQSLLPRFTGYETIKDLPMGDHRDKDLVDCAKVHNQTIHAPHDWIFQPEDDSPATIEAFCLGYPREA